MKNSVIAKRYFILAKVFSFCVCAAYLWFRYYMEAEGDFHLNLVHKLFQSSNLENFVKHVLGKLTSL